MDEFSIDVGHDVTVSASLRLPGSADACLVLAHGAGAGMRHAFMEAVAGGLAARRVATLRYQFPYMEAGSKRPDRPALAQATVRAAVTEAAARLADMPLFAGGKSFGGRMTSQAQSGGALPGVQGLVFFGFPLHLAGKPSQTRADHLMDVEIPMLFIQGTRDALAETTLIREVVDGIGDRAALAMIEDGDHSFHVRVRSGRTDAEAMAQMLDRAASWMQTVAAAK